MTISQATAFLESAFSALNKAYFESALPMPIITIQTSPKAYGHFTVNEVWTDRQRKTHAHEINMSAEALDRPISCTIATLVHEMVHYWCHLQGIQDTSRGTTYHNKRFKEEAEKRGLCIDYDTKIGWSVTTPSPRLKSFCTAQKWRNKLTIVRSGGMGGPEPTTKPKPPSSTRKYVCPCCGQSIRATKDVHLICADCNQTLVKAS